jgi:hypothetical protein
MKLRVRGSSIRLRLTRTEVERLRGAEGRVSDQVRFGPQNLLSYAIVREPSPSTGPTPLLRATFDGAGITVFAPDSVVSTWAGSERVGFDAEQSVGDGPSLRILVEKDWNCLTAREGEEDVDTFPNPNLTC